MERKLLLSAWFGFILLLAGCSSNVKQQPSAPVVDSSNPADAAVVPDPNAINLPPLVPATPKAQPQQAPVLTGNAIASLVTQARAQYQAKNYQAAIAIAERGLRIDRHAPDLYLLLAQSYMQLANTQLAQQFVQQGIRYAKIGSEVAQQLLKVKSSLPQ